MAPQELLTTMALTVRHQFLVLFLLLAVVAEVGQLPSMTGVLVVLVVAGLVPPRRVRVVHPLRVKVLLEGKARSLTVLVVVVVPVKRVSQTVVQK